MTRATFNVLYYINRGKKLKNGTVPIYARITVNKQRSEFAISRFVDADEWNVEIGRVMSTSKSAKEINSYLDLIKSNLLLKKREMEEMGRPINAHDLKNIHLGKVLHKLIAIYERKHS